MLNTMRTSLGKWVVLGIIGLIVFVFLFFGVVDPNSSQGPDAVGEVNGEPIPYFEFSRAVESRRAMLANLKIPTEQLKFLRIEQSVFQELVQRRLVQQEAGKLDLRPSPKEVQAQITKVPAFQKDGAFSLETYKTVLGANQWTPRKFELMMEADLVAQEWKSLFARSVVIPDAEVEEAFKEQNESLTFRYVWLPADSVRKSMEKASASQVEAELQKRAQAIADRLGTPKEAGLNVKKSEPVLRSETSLKEVGYVPELIQAAFASPQSLDPKKGGKARVFSNATGRVVAVIDAIKPADPKALNEEKRRQIRQGLESERERLLFSSWYRDRSKKARITQNQRILGEGA